MQKLLHNVLLTLFVGLCSCPSFAQVRKVITCNPLSRSQASYMEVYEYDYVDVQPQFPGGERGLVNFINKTREYPYKAYRKKLQGRVLCSFIINTDGTVSNIAVIKGAEASLNREAVRVISEMPRWRAGKMGGECVPVRCVLPIAFRL